MTFVPPSLTLADVLLASSSFSATSSSVSAPLRLPESNVLFWATELVAALDWMHARGWAHRDVKPQNLLVDTRSPSGRPGLVLTDFGTASKVVSGGGRRLEREVCLWPVGTPDYIAPEVLEAHEDALVRAEEREDEENEEDGEGGLGYGLEVDWWSVGVVL
jgi:serine/threonine protein kinase